MLTRNLSVKNASFCCLGVWLDCPGSPDKNPPGGVAFERMYRYNAITMEGIAVIGFGAAVVSGIGGAYVGAWISRKSQKETLERQLQHANETQLRDYRVEVYSKYFVYANTVTTELILGVRERTEDFDHFHETHQAISLICTDKTLILVEDLADILKEYNTLSKEGKPLGSIENEFNNHLRKLKSAMRAELGISKHETLDTLSTDYAAKTPTEEKN